MLKKFVLSNGLTVILERVDNVQSVAYNLLFPGGIIHDAQDTLGACLILPDLILRGAAGMDSKELNDAFENAGIRHAESASTEHYVLRGACLGENLSEALRLTSLVVQQPTFPKKEIASIKSSLYQDLRALEDNPARKVSQELSERYFPAPYNRSSLGSFEGIEATSVETVSALWQRDFCPSGAVLSIAGNIDLDTVTENIEAYFGDWSGQGSDRLPYARFPAMYSSHVSYDSAQMQIMLACPSALFGSPDYYTAKLAAGILSGGMFGRLFVEVREKKGLCYSVFARHAANCNYGMLTAYAGTTPERAHETLAAMLDVLRGLPGTLEVEELERARANLLSAVVMGEESTASRAGSNASDWWISGKIRTLDEVKTGIKAVSLEDVEEYAQRNRIEDFMLVTLGAKAIEAVKE